MSGYITFLVCVYFLLSIFSTWAMYKIAKYELGVGHDITIGYLFLAVIACFTPVVNFFFSLFVLSECRKELFGDSIFTKVLIEGEKND